MTLLLLASLWALPAGAEPLWTTASLEQAEAAIERGIRANIERVREFGAGATVYAQADDLAAAADERAQLWKEQVDAFWKVRDDIRRYRRELSRLELQAAADAINARNVDEALRQELSSRLRTATGMELAHKAAFKDLQRAHAADADALRAEKERRRGRKRLQRRAVGALAACAAAALVLLALRRRPPPPAPVKHPVLRRPKGPGRLE